MRHRFYSKLSTLSLVCGLLLVASCSDGAVSDETIGMPNDDSATEGPPSYATATSRHKPLGEIQGSSRAYISEEPNSDALYADAIDYAAALESYALLIWKDGALRVARYFEPHDRELRPESASMHKSVLGLLVARAIADGHIESADARIGDFIPQWDSDPRGDIRVRDLLTMSSGLEPLSSEGGFQAPAIQFIFNGEGARSLILDRPLEATPGEVFHYSGVNTQLLVLVLEAATGKPYADYLSERLWKPLGADDAYVWLNEDDGFPRGYTALMAKAEDWLRVGLMIKDQGMFQGTEIIPAALLGAAISPSTANANYGWQIWLGQEYEPKRFYNATKTGVSVPVAEPFAVDDMIYFDGFGGQRVYVSRSEDLVIVRQGEMRIDWDDAVLPNLVLRAGN